MKCRYCDSVHGIINYMCHDCRHEIKALLADPTEFNEGQGALFFFVWLGVGVLLSVAWLMS